MTPVETPVMTPARGQGPRSLTGSAGANVIRPVAFVIAGIVAVIAFFGMRELTKPSISAADAERESALPVASAQATLSPPGSATVAVPATTTASSQIAPPSADAPSPTAVRPGMKPAVRHLPVPSAVPVRPTAAAASAPVDDCNPPFTTDASGVKIPKRHCFRK